MHSSNAKRMSSNSASCKDPFSVHVSFMSNSRDSSELFPSDRRKAWRENGGLLFFLSFGCHLSHGGSWSTVAILMGLLNMLENAEEHLCAAAAQGPCPGSQPMEMWGRRQPHASRLRPKPASDLLQG